ncbi:hypothetical protein GWI33_021300 [Rhynchophorus ferrugineus]|uniref:Uncharacterized protein n=1 Tax=Rhynchophorus ferrugineus TaxID=354439 RepID=A0A834LYR9_RHYFE|nr:hypothetical protein GWI33_021300 [Rhynchophorus ferrugineus]
MSSTADACAALFIVNVVGLTKWSLMDEKRINIYLPSIFIFWTERKDNLIDIPDEDLNDMKDAKKDIQATYVDA